MAQEGLSSNQQLGKSPRGRADFPTVVLLQEEGPVAVLLLSREETAAGWGQFRFCDAELPRVLSVSPAARGGAVQRRPLLNETYLGGFHVHQLGAKQLADGLVAPADAAELRPRVVRDHVEDELVDAQDPRVPFARVGVPAANDDQVERVRVGEATIGGGLLLGRVEEDELGIGGDGGEGADVRVPDLGDDGRAVRIEEDGDPEGAVVGWAHVE